MPGDSTDSIRSDRKKHPMIPLRRPTLRQLLALSLLGLALGMALLYYLVLGGMERTLIQSSERYRELASRIVAERVIAYLDEAPTAVALFEQQTRYGLLDLRKTDSLERAFLSLLLDHPDISEVTLTYADGGGFDSDGYLIVRHESIGQLTLLRSNKPDEFIRRLTRYDGKRFVASTLTLSSSRGLESAPEPVPNPASHLTFRTAASRSFYGTLIVSDLHWAQIDSLLPESQRRVEVSVQKTVDDAQGHFVGVLRIGLLKNQIDAAVQQHITGLHEVDPHLIFICDESGRLITGFGKHDRVVVSDDDLRIAPADVPLSVTRALSDPILQKIGPGQPVAATSFQFQGKDYLCTFRSLSGTQGWIVGIVVPRDFYLGPIIQTRQQVVFFSLVLILALVLAGVLISRGLVRAQSQVLLETIKMNQFDFSPATNTSFLSDINEILHALEKAKTAMRAMSKYVPLPLVRLLYHKGQEPALGGQTSELTVLFTDIKDFTTFAEKLDPDQLAVVIGGYLEVVSRVIQTEKGTIDKYIGDAVMAFWNAPLLVESHCLHACRAALRCQTALRKLYDTPEWSGRPRFETRMGLHCCHASVGHFGAPDRFNYTAVGDGINLTSRLEGLNKFYGTSIIVSESVVEAAGEEFAFRLLDRVAVKGKTHGIAIHELLSERIPDYQQPSHVVHYEQAFALYKKHDFTAAVKILEQHPDDLPSQFLAARCRKFALELPQDWDGLQRFDSK